MVPRLILSAYLPVATLALAWSMLAPTFPQYLSGLGAGVAVVGVIVALKGIGQVASDVPGGLLIAKSGVAAMTTMSFAAAIVANFVLAFTRSLIIVGTLTFVSGFFTSILLTGVMTTVRTTVDAHLRGRALSGAGGALRIGTLIGPVVGGLVAERFGVPPLFLVRSVVLSVGLASFLAGQRAAGGMQRPHAARPGPLSTLSPLSPLEQPAIQPALWTLGDAGRRLRHGLTGRVGAVVTVGFAILVLSVLRAGREIIVPLWGSSLSLSPVQIGLAMSLGAALDLLLFIPAGIISDRWGRKPAASLCIGVFSVGVVLLPLTAAMIPFVLATMVMGLGNGLGAGINMTTGADLAPDSAVPEFIGLWRMYGDLGTAAGPVIVGLIASATALAPAVFTIAGIGLAGTFVMATLAPETRDLDA